MINANSTEFRNCLEHLNPQLWECILVFSLSDVDIFLSVRSFFGYILSGQGGAPA